MNAEFQQERLREIVKQLVELLGPQASNTIGYIEKNWLEEPHSRGGYMAVMSPNTLRNSGNNSNT